MEINTEEDNQNLHHSRFSFCKSTALWQYCFSKSFKIYFSFKSDVYEVARRYRLIKPENLLKSERYKMLIQFGALGRLLPFLQASLSENIRYKFSSWKTCTTANIWNSMLRDVRLMRISFVRFSSIKTTNIPILTTYYKEKLWFIVILRNTEDILKILVQISLWFVMTEGTDELLNSEWLTQAERNVVWTGKRWSVSYLQIWKKQYYY